MIVILVKEGNKSMITLKQIGNDYFLNGIKGDYWNYNFNGEKEQISYTCSIENGEIIREWKFKD